jgi:hypothetical protein
VHVAVSFCNQHSSPRLAVCAVDLETGARAWLPVPEGFDRGAAGITEIDDDLLVACQPGGLVRYGADLRPVALVPTPGARNLHAILYRPDERSVYVTSAHNDTLFRYRLDDTGTTVVATDEVLCVDPQRRGADRYHLNSVTEWCGDLYVTMFGPADGPTHKHRRNGRLVRVSDGETIVEGLYHPHSAYARGGELFVVESQAHRVRRVAGGREASWEIPGGYPRGIVAGEGDRLWVGVSALRRESSSQGTANVLTAATPIDFRTRLVELDLSTGTITREHDLSVLAAEVFDLRALPTDAVASFTPDVDGGMAARIDALEESLRRVRASRRSLEQELDRTPVRRIQQAARRLRRRVAPA